MSTESKRVCPLVDAVGNVVWNKGKNEVEFDHFTRYRATPVHVHLKGDDDIKCFSYYLTMSNNVKEFTRVTLALIDNKLVPSLSLKLSEAKIAALVPTREVKYSEVRDYTDFVNLLNEEDMLHFKAIAKEYLNKYRADADMSTYILNNGTYEIGQYLAISTAQSDMGVGLVFWTEPGGFVTVVFNPDKNGITSIGTDATVQIVEEKELPSDLVEHLAASKLFWEDRTNEHRDKTLKADEKRKELEVAKAAKEAELNAKIEGNEKLVAAFTFTEGKAVEDLVAYKELIKGKRFSPAVLDANKQIIDSLQELVDEIKADEKEKKAAEKIAAQAVKEAKKAEKEAAAKLKAQTEPVAELLEAPKMLTLTPAEASELKKATKEELKAAKKAAKNK